MPTASFTVTCEECCLPQCTCGERVSTFAPDPLYITFGVAGGCSELSGNTFTLTHGTNTTGITYPGGTNSTSGWQYSFGTFDTAGSIRIWFPDYYTISPIQYCNGFVVSVDEGGCNATPGWFSTTPTFTTGYDWTVNLCDVESDPPALLISGTITTNIFGCRNNPLPPPGSCVVYRVPFTIYN